MSAPTAVWRLAVSMAPVAAAATCLAYAGVLDTQPHPTQHYAQQMRKEADKQWPPRNKSLTFALALAHGT